MIVVIDIDGTITNGERRFKTAGPEPRGRGPKYWAWLNKVQTAKKLLADKPVPGMQQLVQRFSTLPTAEQEPVFIFYLTGREDKYRAVTKQWLKANGFPNLLLQMRPIGDNKPNGEFKEAVINLYNCFSGEPVLVIDDDYTGEIAKVCKKNGWTFLKAMSGGQL
jgi:hypothetical protein